MEGSQNQKISTIDESIKQQKSKVTRHKTTKQTAVSHKATNDKPQTMVPTTMSTPDVTGHPSPLILTPTERFAVLGLPTEPKDGLESLHNDALARVIAFLSYSDTLHCTAVSRVFLHQVAPLVGELTLSHASELRTRPANRFPNVKKVCFFSPGSSVIGEPGLISELVPFLRSFNNLERVVFADALKDRVGILLQLPDENGHFDYESTASPIESIIYVLCDAFRSNALSNKVTVQELFCPRRHRQGEQCYLCRQVVTSFPLCDLLMFDKENCRLNLTFGDALNVQEAEDWMLHIIAKRRGGKDVIRGIFNL